MENRKNERIKWLVILHFGLLLFSFSSVLSKFAGRHVTLSWPFVLLYGGALALLFIYALLWQQVLSRMPLNTAYANRGVTIVWGMLLGLFIFNEKITWNNILGALIVLAGVLLVVSDNEK